MPHRHRRQRGDAHRIDSRPALLAAPDNLRRGSTLVVAKRDRLARDVVIVATIERAAERVGATVTSADGVGVARARSGTAAAHRGYRGGP
ncbi:MAG: recombinase family protein [Deltaproteobacteria bacterium]|nr:recombinase family protein [Deltaproteobacteria bacterium]